MIAWYHLNSPVQRTGTLLLCNGSSRPRLLSFLRGGSEPTFGALQTGIFTGHALSYALQTARTPALLSRYMPLL